MNEELTHIDLFSGIGGFALAARWTGFRTVAFCECEAYAQRVLRKHWPDVPIHEDVRTFPGANYAGATLLTGGFPCQPFSLAGKRGGASDDRFLWPAMVAVIEAARPAWVIGENVHGIVSMELDRCISDMERIGYACWPVVVPACAVGAFHRRDRVWIVAHATVGQDNGRERGIMDGPARQGASLNAAADAGGEDVANSGSTGLQKRDASSVAGRSGFSSWSGDEVVRYATGERLPNWSGGTVGQPSPVTQFERPSGREIERDICGVAHGVSRRVDRLRGLGNAIVPQVAAELMNMIAGIHKQNKQL